MIPLRIVLGPSNFITELFRYRDTSAQFYRRLSANGFGGYTTNYGVPSFKNYTYGPEIWIRGFSLNGEAINLPGRSANYIEMTMSSDEGSCPFLLARSEDGNWVEHGKILDKAPARDLEYTETRIFIGFQPQFRIEEREPELAVLDKAELTVILKSGESLALAPNLAALAQRDGRYVRLRWGEFVDFSFSLPEGFVGDDVVKSRLAVTGYYLRYNNPIVQAEGRTLARLRNVVRRTASEGPVSLGGERLRGPACQFATFFGSELAGWSRDSMRSSSPVLFELGWPSR